MLGTVDFVDNPATICYGLGMQPGPTRGKRVQICRIRLKLDLLSAFVRNDDGDGDDTSI